MPVDPNEIGGFVSHCDNPGYLLSLRAHIDSRLAALGVAIPQGPSRPLVGVGGSDLTPPRIIKDLVHSTVNSLDEIIKKEMANLDLTPLGGDPIPQPEKVTEPPEVADLSPTPVEMDAGGNILIQPIADGLEATQSKLTDSSSALFSTSSSTQPEDTQQDEEGSQDVEVKPKRRSRKKSD